MNSASEPVILVGVDGSRASAAALRWAAAEARRRHAGLRVVRAWNPEFDAPYAPAGVRASAGQQRAAAGADLDAVMRAVFGSRVPAWVTVELVLGMAERVLVDRSAGADLLVLGSASPPTQTARSIGPVIRVCLSRARCPVVVCAADQPAIHHPAPGNGAARYPRPARALVPAPRSGT